MVHLSLHVNMNKKINIPGAWFTRDVQKVSTLFSCDHWYGVSL
jgi:hypothetical protein